MDRLSPSPKDNIIAGDKNRMSKTTKHWQDNSVSSHGLKPFTVKTSLQSHLFDYSSVLGKGQSYVKRQHSNSPKLSGKNDTNNEDL